MILAAQLCPRARRALFRHLPGHADRRHRIRAQRRRASADANSGEFDELCTHKVIDFMPGQSDEIDKGGTLRLGAYPCDVHARVRIMAQLLRRERHLRASPPPLRIQQRFPRRAAPPRGCVLSGLSPDGRLVETVELHGSSVLSSACSITPNSRSRPNRPHPLFRGFVARGARAFRAARIRPVRMGKIIDAHRRKVVL